MTASSLLSPLFASPAVAAFFDDRAQLQGMLDFEAALARAASAVGLIPEAMVNPIVQVCAAEQFDLATLALEGAHAGNLTIPLIKNLTAKVAAKNVDAAKFVHWGATSQDVIDSGLVLQLRAALPLLDADLGRLESALADISKNFAKTPMAGRTLLQHAVPVTMGLKAAGWLSMILRCRARLAQATQAALVLQFGGAAGTLSALGTRGLDVAVKLAAELKLTLPDMPWHTQRDRFADLAAALGLVAGALGKIAKDISLLMQTEVGEAFEPKEAGKGGSSTMPHKRNPVACVVAQAAAARIPNLVASMFAMLPQEHERAGGLWHAEWEVLPQIVLLTSGSLKRMADTVAGLELDTPRMAANLDITQGLLMAEALSMALRDKVGRQQADQLVNAASERAVNGRKHLRDVAAADAAIMKHLTRAEVDQVFKPESYLGAAESFITRVLARRSS